MVTPAPAASILNTRKRGNAKRAQAREWRPSLDPLPLGNPRAAAQLTPSSAEHLPMGGRGWIF
jgi:hypothetical protein